jgi:hypothetical protein
MLTATQKETVLSRLKVVVPDDYEEVLFGQLVDDAAAWAEEYCSRDSIPDGLLRSVGDLAVVAFNRIGTEGESGRSEGGESYSFEEAPRYIYDNLKRFRLVKNPLSSSNKELAITENGTYSVKGYSTANVNVAGVKPTGEISILENGVYDVSEYASARVKTPQPSGNIDITENGSYDVSDYETAEVNTPQPRGSINITENGQYDVAEYATADIQTPVPSGSITLTENGTHDVSEYAEAVVDMLEPSGDITLSENGVADVSIYETATVAIPPIVPDGIIFGELLPLNIDRGVYYTDPVQMELHSSPCVMFVAVAAAGETEDIPPMILLEDVGEFKDNFLAGESITVEESTNGISVSFNKAAIGRDLEEAFIVIAEKEITQPTGSLAITENGDYDVSSYASATVNVPTSGGDSFVDYAKGEMTGTKTIPDTDVLMGHAFQRNSSTAKLVFPNTRQVGSSGNFPVGNTAYSGYTFEGYSGDIEIPNMDTLTGENNFSNSGITKGDFEKLSQMQKSSNFWGCSQLEEVRLRDLSSISSNTFTNCSSLTRLIITRTSTSIMTLSNSNALTGTPIASGSGYIYVPDALVETYKAATNWSVYASQIKGLSEVPT